MRGAAVPIEIRDTPYFLISYPHTPRNGEGSERDPDLLVSKFCDDLSRCVEELTWRPERTHVGILDRAVWFGDDWETGLPEALCTCRVLVPLYSPRYFQSIHCGKEWSAFADQPSIPGTTARQAPPIVPAIWEPVDLKSVDSAAVRAVPVEYFGLESYEAHGIEGIINLAAYRADYTAVVRELARRIVAAAQGLPASPRRVIDYATLPSAFDPEADLRSADPRLRVTVVAPHRGTLPSRRRNALYYGMTAQDWAPYQPASATPIAEFTAGFARSLRFHAHVDELSAREACLLSNEPPADPELLLIDPWAVTNRACLALLSRFNLADKPWVQLVIPWNPADTETEAESDRLRRALRSALRRKLELGRATSVIAVEGVPGFEELRTVLPGVILAAVKQYLAHARAYPPPGKPMEKPLWHGFTLSPPNPMEHTGG